MSAVLNYTTSGKMEIFLDGMKFAGPIKSPQINVGNLVIESEKIKLNSNNHGEFTEWGSIQIIDIEAWEGYVMVTIDCDKWGYFGAAQFQLVVNGQIVLSDNFHSGVRGPLGDPKLKKQYKIGNF